MNRSIRLNFTRFKPILNDTRGTRRGEDGAAIGRGGRWRGRWRSASAAAIGGDVGRGEVGAARRRERIGGKKIVSGILIIKNLYDFDSSKK